MTDSLTQTQSQHQGLSSTARTPKTPGSRATVAAIRSLAHSPAGPQLTFSEAVRYLYSRGARFVLLCDQCDFYSRPRCREHNPELPASALAWSQWHPSPEDVRAAVGFDERRPSSDHWGVPVRHLPIGIEAASLGVAVLDVDRYNLHDLADLVRTAPPAALTISRSGGAHLWYTDPWPPYDKTKQRHFRRNGKFTWRGLSGDRKAFHGYLRVLDLVDLAEQLMEDSGQRIYPAGIIDAAAAAQAPQGKAGPLLDIHEATADRCIPTGSVQGLGEYPYVPSRLQGSEGLDEGCEGEGKRYPGEGSEPELKGLGDRRKGGRLVDSVPTGRLPAHLEGMIPPSIGWKTPQKGVRHSMAVQMAGRVLGMPRNWTRPLEDLEGLMAVWNAGQDEPPTDKGTPERGAVGMARASLQAVQRPRGV